MATPKLRFDGFSGNWVTTQLGNVCSFTQGVQIPQSEQINEERDGYIRYLYIRDFFSDKFKCYVPNIYPEKIIHPHEIMMVNTGNTTGEAYTGRYGVLSNNSFKISYDLAHFNDQFMYLFCSSELAQNQIKKFFNAGGQPHLGHKNISQILISYPKKEEQTKIASFLSAVDEKISQLTQKHELLSQYKQGMMQKLFSQQIRFKADDGSEFGEWASEKISKVFTNKSKSFNPLLNESLPCIELEHLSQNTGQILGTVNSSDQQSTKNLFEPNSVLYGKLRPYLRKFAKPQFKGVCSSEIWVLTGLKISNDYLFQFVQSEQFTELTNIQSGSKMPRADWNVIADSEIEFPCLEEQTKIANFLSAIDQKVEVVAQQIKQAKTWKKGLLQQMFV